MGLKRYGLNVMWVGKPSMRWSSIVPVVQSMINCFGLPKAVICHCGGNEIGCMSTVSLFFQLICSLYTINKMCPGSNIVFSNILPRKEWHYSTNHRAMKDIPKRLNRGKCPICYNIMGITFIMMIDLDDCHDALYAHDGVHLSFFMKGFLLSTHYRELLNSSF